MASKVDCRAAFNQILLAAAYQKTPFWWNGRLWKYTRNLYSLRNTMGQFQMVIDQGLRCCGLDHCAMALVDDILVSSPILCVLAYEQHLLDCAAVFACLQQCGLKLHPDIIAVEEVEFLGHIVSTQGLRPMEAKISAILALQPPKNLTELQVLLGLANYYRGYVPKFSELAALLKELTHKGVLKGTTFGNPAIRRCWTHSRTASTKRGSSSAAFKPIVCSYCTRISPPMASAASWASCMMTGRNTWSLQSLAPSTRMNEHNYIACKGEMFAACWAMQTQRPYLHGVPFMLATDHTPLLIRHCSWRATPSAAQASTRAWPSS
ncbi:hypothetical protein Vretimale_19323 [Volvox reticuliferus]|uniref:Reverse transcriptase RNase H-like domain-containing protein n=1 Tax=Volvox reticuliferus TaxID=1737510 RepID=A0A8J4M075_9CHLO|nr:hypothetical protein Vretimale_19323 [Volvox reticuliferus]